MSVFFALFSYGQCLYSKEQTINMGNVTYIADMGSYGCLLHDVKNVWTFTKRAMKDGSHFKGGLDDAPNPYDSNKDVVETVYEIVYSVLTKTELEMTKGETLIITMFINSDTGIIDEMNFSFFIGNNKWCRIPPEKYYAIEQKIRNSGLKFTMLEGKKYTYNLCWIPVKYHDGWYEKILPPIINPGGEILKR